jgi:hypothetical protein
MKQPEADWRELAMAVDRVHRVDASIDHTLHELRRVSQRQLVTTGAALGLGVAALATLRAAGSRSTRTSGRRPMVGALLATLAPWAVDVAFRYLSSRSARGAPRSASQPVAAERRNSLPTATQGDPR